MEEPPRCKPASSLCCERSEVNLGAQTPTQERLVPSPTPPLLRTARLCSPLESVCWPPPRKQHVRTCTCACVCECQFPVLTEGEKQAGRVYQRGTLLQNILDEAKVVFIRCINIHDEW